MCVYPCTKLCEVSSIILMSFGQEVTVDKLSSLVDRQEQYSRRNCILIHSVKKNQNEDTDKVVVNKIKSKMDLESSSGYIYRKQRIGVLSKGK